ncbi:transposable element Tc3 transposase [Trichonephila clavipes]|uniref:Transposable element Tc3 transposase n=1 Tax=Trichonephila clavipes TaxID=2585209 RepID=A0A8X6SCE2_TRICX|nr:transposable element Tc3 transposase [Trichonephila clavipes]
MSSPGFKPSPNGTAVTVADHYTGWAAVFKFNDEFPRLGGTLKTHCVEEVKTVEAQSPQADVREDRYFPFLSWVAKLSEPALGQNLTVYDMEELWFHQDGATCHTARATIDLLKDTFGDRLISRFGPVNWPPRSCDLTPLDYFLWGYVKSLVYADKPQTLDHLEDNIRRVIADIRPQILEKVIQNWTSRLDYIRASRGSPMPEIIFKM